MNAFLSVAENEFTMIARNPIVLVFVGFLLILALVNTAGYSVMQDMFGQAYDHDTSFYIGIQNIFIDFSTDFAFLAMCIGVISIAEERSKGSLRVLFTKPLYRRDVIAGKFLGISSFFVLIITLAVTVFVSLEIAFYGGPSSISGLVLKLGTYMFILLLNSCFTLGVVILFGIILEKREALVLSVAYIIYEWLAQIGTITSALKDYGLFDPSILYWKIYSPVIGLPGHELLAADQPYVVWLQNAYPYLTLFVLEVVIIILVDCALFSREEA